MILGSFVTAEVKPVQAVVRKCLALVAIDIVRNRQYIAIVVACDRTSASLRASYAWIPFSRALNPPVRGKYPFHGVQRRHQTDSRTIPITLPDKPNH